MYYRSSAQLDQYLNTEFSVTQQRNHSQHQNDHKYQFKALNGSVVPI